MLDGSVKNSDVNINGYSIIRNDRNRNGGGVACYIRFLTLILTFFKFY